MFNLYTCQRGFSIHYLLKKINRKTYLTFEHILRLTLPGKKKFRDKIKVRVNYMSGFCNLF